MLNINWSNNIHSVFNLDMDKHKGIFMAGSGGLSRRDEGVEKFLREVMDYIL